MSSFLKHSISWFDTIIFFRENLIRIAFQCLQLVITDFLPVMPWRCLPLCVDTVSKFGSQTQELNISLTAVGLMVSRKIHMNRFCYRETVYDYRISKKGLILKHMVMIYDSETSMKNLVTCRK